MSHSALLVRKRDGRVVRFDQDRIATAVGHAFRWYLGIKPDEPLDSQTAFEVLTIRDLVVNAVRGQSSEVSVEDVQDAVEVTLMERKHFKIARHYITYRLEHAKRRAAEHPGPLTNSDPLKEEAPSIRVKENDGSYSKFDRQRMLRDLLLCFPSNKAFLAEDLADDVCGQIYDGITPKNISHVMVLAARARVEKHPDFDNAARDLMLMAIYRELWPNVNPRDKDAITAAYKRGFLPYLERGVALKRLHPNMLEAFHPDLAGALVPANDRLFPYAGLQTLYDRYLLHDNGERFEAPQYLWMRVAMGIAMAEPRECQRDRTHDFYGVMATHRYIPSTPTLFNSGTLNPQMSSCFLTTVQDDLDHIFHSVDTNAKMSKWAGGIGNDWTNVRATNAWIKGTNGPSQGLIPFLKVAETTAVAVNQGSKRKGAVCAYLECWHLDFPEFCELHRKVGDEYRRTLGMHTAAWIPDLFMQRVRDGGLWSLFSPEEVPELHDTYGNAFQSLYEQYEAQGVDGKLRLFKQVPAVELWRKLLTNLFETGHPWITFKDPINLRSTQSHVGTVHSSNLCASGDTRTLTETGYRPLRELSNENGGEHKLWNGRAFSLSKVAQTGAKRHLVRVSLNNGVVLKVTAQHVWHVVTNYKGGTAEKTTAELKSGDRLVKFELPTIEGRGSFKYPYTAGIHCGDGSYHAADRPTIAMYGEKKALVEYMDVRTGSGVPDANDRLNYQLPRDLPTKFTLPWEATTADKMEWLSGYADTDGTIARNGTNESLQLCSTNKAFLLDLRLMLQTVGVDSRLNKLADEGMNMLPDGHGGMKEYWCETRWRLLFNSVDTQRLLELGFSPHRLKIERRNPNREAKHFIKVVGVVDHGDVEDTYCFNEPARHMGMFEGVLAGNCTEITLNTSREEHAVCNLGSINLVAHLASDRSLNEDKLRKTVTLAIRMLDNVIDVNHYTTPETETANRRHRPVGLGIMGFQDAIRYLGHAYDSEEAVEFADRSTELISFLAIDASCRLAVERGRYSSFNGSSWSRGELPMNSLSQLAQYGREIDMSFRLDSDDWYELGQRVRGGMRNSQVMAIAPTATISNIVGVSQSIEPYYKHLYGKKNMSGVFTELNVDLVRDLEARGLWDDEMLDELKRTDGTLANIDRVPDDLKRLYKTAFELDQKWLIECASRRQKWLDMSQSLNLYAAEPNGRALSEMYMLAWKRGLKTTYYLRTLGASQVEKSTVEAKESAQACSITDGSCQACQ